MNPSDRNRHAPRPQGARHPQQPARQQGVARPQVAHHPQAPAKPHMRRAPHHNRATGSRQASRSNQAPRYDQTSRRGQVPRSSRTPRNLRTRIAGIAAVLVLIALVGMGGTALFRAMSKGGNPSQDKPGSAPIIEDSTAGGGAGEIVIGLNGSKDTYVLKGEEYLEAGAHAAEPADGLLNAKIKTSGTVSYTHLDVYKRQTRRLILRAERNGRGM